MTQKRCALVQFTASIWLRNGGEASSQPVPLLSRGSQTNRTLYHQLTPALHLMLHDRQHNQSIWGWPRLATVEEWDKFISACRTVVLRTMIVPPGVTPLQAPTTLRRSLSRSSRCKATLIAYSLHQVVLEHVSRSTHLPRACFLAKELCSLAGGSDYFLLGVGVTANFKLERVHLTMPSTGEWRPKLPNF